MPDLLEVILINLIVSFDNIGVIALAARGLNPKKANMARQVGIWLSLVLKLVFTLLVGWLFTISWLHIRIIGGAMLFYVIFGMIRDTGSHEHSSKTTSFWRVIAIIVLADISMSLDNVIAVISIVADDAGRVTAQGMSVAFLGLAISVPVLLIASEHIIRLINKHTALFALCAGYLGYIAANMIFEDALIEDFFVHVNFHHATLLAIAVGAIVTYISWRIANSVNKAAQLTQS